METASLASRLDSLSSSILALPPPVDPGIPLEGFTWDAASGFFANPAAGYTFHPVTKLFRSNATGDEYFFDVSASLYRPRHADDDAEPFKDLLSSGLKLQQQLSARTEVLSSLIGQLTRRFTPQRAKEGESPEGEGAENSEGPNTAPPHASAKMRLGANAANTVARVPALRLPLGSPRSVSLSSVSGLSSSTPALSESSLRLESPQLSVSSHRAHLGTKSPKQPDTDAAQAVTSVVKSVPLGLASGSAHAPTPGSPIPLPHATAPSAQPIAPASSRSLNSAPLGRHCAAASPATAVPTAPAASAAPAAAVDLSAAAKPTPVPMLNLGSPSPVSLCASSLQSRNPLGNGSRGPPVSARSAYGHEAYEAESASARLEGGDEGAESARHELEAAREALRASKGRHTRELDAVRRGWTSRCDELTTTVARLRAELASSEMARARAEGGTPTASPAATAAEVVPPRSPVAPKSPGAPSSSKAAMQSQLDALTAALADAQHALGAAANDVRTAREAAKAQTAEAKQNAETAAWWQAEAQAAQAAHASAEREVNRLSSDCDGLIAVQAGSLASKAVEEAQVAQAAAAAREAHREAESLRLVESFETQLASLAAQLLALTPAAGEAATAAGAEGECRRAVASAEGRLQLEQQRHSQQLDRLQFENEELRRASKAKSEKIATLKAALDAASWPPN